MGRIESGRTVSVVVESRVARPRAAIFERAADVHRLDFSRGRTMVNAAGEREFAGKGEVAIRVGADTPEQMRGFWRTVEALTKQTNESAHDSASRVQRPQRPSATSVVFRSPH